MRKATPAGCMVMAVLVPTWERHSMYAADRVPRVTAANAAWVSARRAASSTRAAITIRRGDGIFQRQRDDATGTNEGVPL